MRRPPARIALGGALVLTVGMVAGALLATAGGDDDPTTAELDRERQRSTRLAAERDRLRQERNQLEARLAADGEARVCPAEYVSTGTLLPLFSVDYPCAWHVLFDPTSPVATEDRPGLRAEVLLVSRLPVSLAPRGGPIADVELVDWTDDPADDEDMLPTVTAWLDEERERFTSLQTDDSFEAGDGLTVYRLIGEQDIFDEPVTVTVMLWRYDDAVEGARHIARAFALEPSAPAAAALDRLARSFRVREP